MEIYGYYSFGNIVIKCGDNYIKVSTKSINRFSPQRYRLFVFESFDRFNKYKEEMSKKHHIPEYKWEIVGKFNFNNALVSGDTKINSHDFSDFSPFLTLNGEYTLYIRFGYAYFVSHENRKLLEEF